MYDLGQDPEQLKNVAGQSEYAEIQRKLQRELTTRLQAAHDPRVVESHIDFDAYPYLGGGPKHPSAERPNR